MTRFPSREELSTHFCDCDYLTKLRKGKDRFLEKNNYPKKSKSKKWKSAQGSSQYAFRIHLTISTCTNTERIWGWPTARDPG
eukprot:526283-Pelagomonas_calceolata.AAC.1